MEQLSNSPQNQNEVTESQPSVDSSNFESKVNSLTNLISELANSQQSIYQELNNFKTAINSKLEQQTTMVPEKDTDSSEPDWWSDFDPDSKRAVQSEVDHKVNKLKQEVFSTLEEREAAAAKKREQENKILQARQKYDNMAAKEFPQLAEESHPLRAEFNKLWSEKLSMDETYAQSPTSVYDLARIAYANLVNRGEIVPDSFKNEARRLISVNDGSIPKYRGSVPSKPTELSDQQLFFAKKLGVNPENYIKRLRSNYKDRDMS